MKKSIIYILTNLCLVLLSSCKDTLDTKPTEFFGEETVWGSYHTADAFVNATYASVLNGLWAGAGTAITWECRTPNSVLLDLVSKGIDPWTTETGLSASDDLGANQSSRLRKCNLIIEKATASDVLGQDEKARLVAEGKFLRALTFYDQARKMGRFLPVRHTFKQDDTLVVKEIRMTSSIKESYDIIISDFEDAIAGLPDASLAGRANKFAAEVFLSEACLQAYAYTGDKSYLDKVIAAAKDVVSRNELSAKYSSMFNETGQYDFEILFGYYRLAENSTLSKFQEVMRTPPNITLDNQKISQCPVPFNNKNGQTFTAWGIYWPTQDLVDNYLVIDDKTKEALPWWETSQWKENVEELDPATVTVPGQIDAYKRLSGEPRRIPSDQDLKNVNSAYPNFTRYAVLKANRPDRSRNISDLMYQNRDARFHGSVVTDGDIWVGELIHTNLDGNASAGVRDKEDGGWYNTATNYYWRKNTIEHPNPRYYHSVKCDMHYVLARVGEAWMNLAEAYLCLGNVEEAVKALNATRETHGELPPSTASTLKDAWKDYIRERNCEMCNESGDLYFSFLRWGKYGGYANEGRPAGDIVAALDQPIHKIEISRDRSAILIGQVTLMNASGRRFTTKRYLFPIAQKFLDTREAYGLDHEQNEGW